jgi:hypothetical protein
MPVIKSPAHRRYVRRVAAAMAGYLVTLFTAEILIDKRHLAGPLAYLFAVLPGLCVAGVFWALARLLVEEKDEYLRTLLVRQILIASGITMVAASIYSFLEMYRLVQPAHGFYVIWLFFLALGVGGIVNKLTYGDSGSC